ncbi:vWA domain-containing protein [Thalassoroseus pseudoceratinae]|uniref:vWA domain-containing protein n=1 Tax=Thalassoroseus pseudoceratinae TaxID=2713176 RepID=UPI001423345E|nr:BatA and WFA domain-containing protein [Thalassoroseus pseudoceratinae]
MSFANPWGLLALLAMPAIVAIHMYHRRFPPIVVAGVHLWGVQHEMRSVGRKRERLPITPSLLLELLAAFLIAMILSQPRFGELGRATHLVVVLDNSASMQAEPNRNTSFRDLAATKLLERLDELNRGSRVTALITGNRPETLIGPLASVDEAREQISEWQPTASIHEFSSAWDQAAQFAGDSGDMLFLTDHLPTDATPLPRRMETWAVGERLPNVAILAARWQIDPDSADNEIYLRFVNYNTNTAVVSVQGRAGEQPIFEQDLTIAPGAETPLLVPVPSGLGIMTIDLSTPQDGLAIDNAVTLIEPRERPVKIAVDLAADPTTQAAVNKAIEAIPDIEQVSADDADLVITSPNPLPRSDRELWWLGIGPLSRTDEAKEAAVDLGGPYILEKRHPLLEGLELGNLVWGGVQEIGLNVNPLITADQLPLLGQLEGTRTTAFLLNIDLSRSQLSESENWPILLSNLIELRRDDLPGLRRWNYRVGEIIRFRWPLSESDTDLQLVSEQSERELARDLYGIVEIGGLDQPGVYEIFDGEKLLDRFAVNFHDPRESVLTALNDGVIEPQSTETANDFRFDNPYSWLILLALAVVMVAALADWRVVKA